MHGYFCEDTWYVLRVLCIWEQAYGNWQDCIGQELTALEAVLTGLAALSPPGTTGSICKNGSTGRTGGIVNTDSTARTDRTASTDGNG